MSSAKEDILARIRSSLADAPVAPEPVRNYRRVSELTEEQTIDMLVDRLIDYKANVFHANKENISEVIAERLGEKSTYVVPEGLNMEWLPADTADRKRVTDSGSTLKPGCLSLKELDAVDAGIVEGVIASNAQASGEGRLGSIGLVIGATVGGAVSDLGIDLQRANGPLLAPGVGAQGAGPAELEAVFGPARRQVLASTSRGVLKAGPSIEALRKAASASAYEAATALR